jgi:DNA repair exonuclease SbcCD nuclease subunit
LRKYLLVGDVHATEKDLNDCQELLKLILDTISRTGAMPIFMGDLYHTHSIVRIEVQKFWADAFAKMNVLGVKPIVIMGNHDSPTGAYTGVNALILHKFQATVVLPEEPFNRGDFMAIAYHRHGDAFIVEANKPEHQAPVLLCHATFDGAQYENGFYAKDGIDQAKIPHVKIISGHIHKTSLIGKVLYIGSPRWLTISDSEQEERWLFLVDDEFNFLEKIPTSPVCRVIHRLIDTEDAPLGNIDFCKKDHYIVDIHGRLEFINVRKSLYRGKARVRTFEKKENATAILKESDPLNVSLVKWLKAYSTKYLDKEKFIQKIKEDLFYANKLG